MHVYGLELVTRALLSLLLMAWFSSITPVEAKGAEKTGGESAQDLWPSPDWPSAQPADVGLNVEKLQQARDYALSVGGSGMIVRHGKVVLRWGDQKERYDIKSATKSFGATMLGVAVKDGKIDLDAPAKRYHPTFGVPPESNAQTSWLDDITIRHLATQTAGFEKPGGYEKLLFEPGTQWHYSDGGPNWLAECITLVYEQDLEDLMFERVFTPLGIERDDLRWRNNQYRDHQIEGIPRREFGAGIHANVEALSRLGYLYLKSGKWKDQQILPKEFVSIATQPVEAVVGLPEWPQDDHGNASDHYGLLWWNNVDGALQNVPTDAYWAWGLYDSLIVVIPSLDLVVVRGGARGKKWPRDDGADHYDVLKPFLDPIVAAANSNGSVSLFDGRSLDGWQGGGEGWTAVGGNLVYEAPRKGKDSAGRERLKLMSAREYSDFILRFEFKLQQGANNGVAIRAPLDGDPAFVGMEVQVIDTDGWPGRLKPFQVHGSIYGVVPAKSGHLKPAGQWNAQEILCQGRRMKVTLNGTVIVDASLDEVEPIDGRDHPGLKRDKGYIGFLGHTKGVAYRNIRIKELPSTTVPVYATDSSAAPYPPSEVITGIEWAPPETIIRLAEGSDNWPMTWADDDHLYTAYGDGWGFEPKVEKKISLGLARVEGDPPDVRGHNIRSDSGEDYGDGRSGKKASGMLMVEGVLYMLVRNADNSQLAWSEDHGKTWTWADWKFTTSFGYPTFLNFGKNYAGARDDYIYIYSSDSDSAYVAGDRMVLARVPQDRITDRDAYQFFVRLDSDGNPQWSADVNRRGAVFSHPGRCYRLGISYNAPLKRYLWCHIYPESTDSRGPRFQGGFGIYEAPEPWGPWTTIYHTDEWDIGPGETSSFPTKWMSEDGRTLHLVFSGDDHFSVRRARLTLSK